MKIEQWSYYSKYILIFTFLFTPNISHGQNADRKETVISLANGSFTIQSGIPSNLRTRISEQIDTHSFLSNSSKVPLILISSNPNLTLSALRKIGFTTTERLSKTAYIIRVALEELEPIMKLPALNALELFPPEEKIDTALRRILPYEWQTRDNDAVAYSILVYPGTSVEDIENLRRIGLVNKFENYNTQTVERIRVFTVVTAKNNLEKLARIPFINRIEAIPAPNEKDNEAWTQLTSNVAMVQEMPYNLSGVDISIGVWESGEGEGWAILPTHESLIGRVSIVDSFNNADIDNHATHVAGTIASSGVTEGTKGMAPAAQLSSYSSNGDTSEMLDAKLSSNGPTDPPAIQISNHSYGQKIGWSDRGAVYYENIEQFGAYTNFSVAIDNVVDESDLIVVKSAGNHRSDKWNGTSTSIPDPLPPRDCEQPNQAIDADCLSPFAVAKNVITVGAVFPTDSEVAIFSSVGPTNDGRIKPDLMAIGATTSTGAINAAGMQNNTIKYYSIGTSSSTPTVSGIVALLLEEASNQGTELSAAAVKAILIQTASDVTENPAKVGPDYASGWGIVDALEAIKHLRNIPNSGILQDTIDAPGSATKFSKKINVPYNSPELKITLAWTDPAGNISSSPIEPNLVNDLDLRLISPAGTIKKPWVLDPTNLQEAAVRDGGDDSINNVEQISVLNPPGGTWEVQITAKETSFIGPQEFALAGPIYSNTTSINVAEIIANIKNQKIPIRFDIQLDIDPVGPVAK